MNQIEPKRTRIRRRREYLKQPYISSQQRRIDIDCCSSVWLCGFHPLKRPSLFEMAFKHRICSFSGSSQECVQHNRFARPITVSIRNIQMPKTYFWLLNRLFPARFKSKRTSIQDTIKQIEPQNAAEKYRGAYRAPKSITINRLDTKTKGTSMRNSAGIAKIIANGPMLNTMMDLLRKNAPLFPYIERYLKEMAGYLSRR